MQDFVFIAFISFSNIFGQFWVETSLFRKCIYSQTQIYKMAAHSSKTSVKIYLTVLKIFQIEYFRDISLISLMGLFNNILMVAYCFVHHFECLFFYTASQNGFPFYDIGDQSFGLLISRTLNYVGNEKIIKFYRYTTVR